MGQSFSLLCLYNQSKDFVGNMFLDSPSKAVIFQLTNRYRNIEKVIAFQNKKSALQEFLFGNEGTRMGEESDNNSHNKASNLRIQLLEDQIQNLHNQVNSLQQKVIQLEAKFMTFEQNSKHALSEPLQPLESSKTIQQENYFSNQEKAQNRVNFITSEDNLGDDVWRSPGKISEDEKIEIIQLGFQLNQQGKISLKKYYESKDSNSLFQLKGYQIKYETIRRTKLYQQLKE